jgi:hypothetical protein
MVKYFCDHCNKMINERRKYHRLSEIHKKNKGQYYQSFSSSGPSQSDWEFIESSEQRQFLRYLKRTFLDKLYTAAGLRTNK